MSSISIEIPDNVLDEAARRARDLGLSRDDYIRRALERMNSQASPAARAITGAAPRAAGGGRPSGSNEEQARPGVTTAPPKRDHQ